MLAKPGHCARHCAGYCARQARDRLHGPVVAHGHRLLGLGSHLVLLGEVRALGKQLLVRTIAVVIDRGRE
jgi:hypothetical protein